MTLPKNEDGKAAEGLTTTVIEIIDL